MEEILSMLNSWMSLHPVISIIIEIVGYIILALLVLLTLFGLYLEIQDAFKGKKKNGQNEDTDNIEGEDNKNESDNNTDNLFDVVEVNEETLKNESYQEDYVQPFGKQLTVYMSYLQNLHLTKYKVIHIIEKDYQESNRSKAYLLDAFLFCIAENDRLVLFAYESTWNRKSTLFFAIDKNRVETASHNILRFFQSWESNKRLKLRKQKNHFVRSGCLWQDTANHRTGKYKKWTENVQGKIDRLNRS